MIEHGLHPVPDLSADLLHRGRGLPYALDQRGLFATLDLLEELLRLFGHGNLLSFEGVTEHRRREDHGESGSSNEQRSRIENRLDCPHVAPRLEIFLVVTN